MEQTTNLQKLNQSLNAESVQKRFNDMLGKKAPGFITSITNAVTNNALLQKAEPKSIILAAAQAASLDLPINPNLGLAAIIPFYDGKTKTTQAQMQIMVNGYVDLAMRSGQFKTLTVNEVYEGELVSKNRFTDEYVFDETKRKSDKIIGYVAYMKLVNGFEKYVYWTVEECKAHGLRYSQTFKKGYGLWVDAFDKMSKKSVIKHLIVKYAPKSIETLNMAIEKDQATFSGDIEHLENATIQYVDAAAGEQKAEFVEAQDVNDEKTEDKVEEPNMEF